MAPDAEIYDYRVFEEVLKSEYNDSHKSENIRNTDQYITEAIHDAIKKGCDIINLSFARKEPNEIPPYVEKTRQAVAEAGIIVICAAGFGDGDEATDEFM